MVTGGLKSILASAITAGLSEARARIFGHVLNPTGQKSANKILRKKLFGRKCAEWYIYNKLENENDLAKYDPSVAARREQMRLSKLEMLKRRGKGPPKKGQGKRASKRKTKTAGE